MQDAAYDKPLMKPFLSLTLSIIIGTIILSLIGFYSAIRPIRITSKITPQNYGIPYEKVSFKTKDGVIIKGWFIKNSNPKAKTIILLHGYPADKNNIFPIMMFLHKQFNLLFIDFRYFGESGGRYSTIGKDEVNDLLAAIAYLETRGIHEVGVWGFSLGGAVALLTAPSAPQIKVIIADSSFARLDWMALEYYKIPLLYYPLALLTRLWALIFLHYDIKDIFPARSAAQLTIPILYIHSKQDEIIPFEHAQLFQRLNKNPLATFLFIDKNRHGQLLENYQEVVLNFFKKNM